MNEYDTSRTADLKTINSSLTEEDYVLLVKYENKLTECKDISTNLYEEEVITYNILAEKIYDCFLIFLTKVTDKFGEEFCLSMYDYTPTSFKDSQIKNALIQKNQ